MGDKKTNFYLGDPFNQIISTLTAETLNNYVNSNLSRKIGDWSSVLSLSLLQYVSSD